MVVIRDFRAEDACHISELFREVYADRYVYSALYMPTMIAWHNLQRHWYSAVAIENNCVIGHAALWRDEKDHCAELAMFATHPTARNRGVATGLGLHLCREARKQQLSTLTIKMVCSHPHTQRLAKSLGFHTTALLRDYVASPFASQERESVALGVLALRPRPVPEIVGLSEQPCWLSLLRTQFGHSVSSCVQPDLPLEITDIGDRVEVTIHQLSDRVAEEVIRLPSSRLIYLRVRIDSRLVQALPVFYRSGYRDMGLMPDHAGGWLWLFQRGFRQHNLQLCCPTARVLQACSLPD